MYIHQSHILVYEFAYQRGIQRDLVAGGRGSPHYSETQRLEAALFLAAARDHLLEGGGGWITAPGTWPTALWRGTSSALGIGNIERPWAQVNCGSLTINPSWVENSAARPQRGRTEFPVFRLVFFEGLVKELRRVSFAALFHSWCWKGANAQQWSPNSLYKPMLIPVAVKPFQELSTAAYSGADRGVDVMQHLHSMCWRSR